MSSAGDISDDRERERESSSLQQQTHSVPDRTLDAFTADAPLSLVRFVFFPPCAAKIKKTPWLMLLYNTWRACLRVPAAVRLPFLPPAAMEERWRWCSAGKMSERRSGGNQ
ncbi:hypothetical protein ATANTOWER_001863 [Ataeniobius toweri]|uniref:Uncharacterized protein n=1 Tax=Ataeniobius toweri TaxID=208326 RepID=A0ABU7AXR6_9TELE|nr:hypothetical protein [Ataeniobius toweri]